MVHEVTIELKLRVDNSENDTAAIYKAMCFVAASECWYGYGDVRIAHRRVVDALDKEVRSRMDVDLDRIFAQVAAEDRLIAAVHYYVHRNVSGAPSFAELKAAVEAYDEICEVKK